MGASRRPRISNSAEHGSRVMAVGRREKGPRRCVGEMQDLKIVWDTGGRRTNHTVETASK